MPCCLFRSEANRLLGGGFPSIPPLVCTRRVPCPAGVLFLLFFCLLWIIHGWMEQANPRDGGPRAVAAFPALLRAFHAAAGSLYCYRLSAGRYVGRSALSWKFTTNGLEKFIADCRENSLQTTKETPQMAYRMIDTGALATSVLLSNFQKRIVESKPQETSTLREASQTSSATVPLCSSIV